MRDDELRREIGELREYARQQSELVQAFDRELRPFWDRERQIKDAILCTHPWITGKRAQELGLPGASSDQKYVIGYGADMRTLRGDLFAELDNLIETWGPIRTERREAKMEMEAALRAAERLQERLAHPPKERRPVTLDLFR